MPQLLNDAHENPMADYQPTAIYVLALYEQRSNRDRLPGYPIADVRRKSVCELPLVSFDLIICLWVTPVYDYRGIPMLLPQLSVASNSPYPLVLFPTAVVE